MAIIFYNLYLFFVANIKLIKSEQIKKNCPEDVVQEILLLR